MSPWVEVLSNDALLTMILESGDLFACHGAATLAAVCKDVRRARRRVLAQRYGCGNDVLMLWFVLQGQRLYWIIRALHPLMLYAQLAWRDNSKRTTAIKAAFPLPLGFFTFGPGYCVRSKLSSAACAYYGATRGVCTATPEYDMEEVVNVAWMPNRLPPPGHTRGWGDLKIRSSPQYPDHDPSYAKVFEEGTPRGFPFRFEEDEEDFKNVARVDRDDEGREALVARCPKANPATPPHRFLTGTRAVGVAFDGLAASLEALAWETDLSQAIDAASDSKSISVGFCTKDALVYTRDVMGKLANAGLL